MGLTPSTPQFSPRTFWQKPEGKTGIVFMIAAALAAAYGLYIALPYLIEIVSNTIELVVLSVVLFLLLYIITHKSVRSLASNVFQSVMRALTGMFIQIDPIGILKNNLSRMRDRKDELDANIAKVSGAKKNLEMAIAKKNDQIQHDHSMAAEAVKRANAERDPLAKQRWMLSKQSCEVDASMKMKSVDNLSKLLAQTKKMYEMLVRWSNLADYQITNTQNQAEELAEQRKSILAASAALSSAKRLIKGDPEQVKLVDQTLEFLAEDTANKVGDMEDFARYSEKYLDNMDLETGAAANDAESKFAEYESKLLSAGSAPTVSSIMNTRQDPQGVYVPVSAGRQEPSASYDDLLK